MKANEYYVLKGPVVTEESTLQTAAHNKYVFRVDPKANKKEIREAVEAMYKVTVVRVNTMNYQGKEPGRSRGNTGRRASWKKAIVSLAPGDAIDLL
jgi:large subunit ribosomal protein L23